MCGRFTLRANLNRVLDEMRIGGDLDWPPSFNICPTQAAPVVRLDDGKRSCTLLRWGLIPSWAKDPKIGSQMINARAETVAEKPSFRTAFKRRRCLVLTDGYYEWKPIDKKKKQPYFIHRPDDSVFTFAGLWEYWQPAGGDPLETFTIITTTANESGKAVHDRMPVTLFGGECDAWLDAGTDTDTLLGLLRPAAEDTFVAEPRGPRDWQRPE